MSFLRGSTNYVWCTTSVLGKGATGAVFQGVNKNTGESVAVKTFNPYSHMRPPEVQMREFEVLKKVNHINIVKLLAIEDDQEGRGKVIVMELCTGGSLFNILDDPEHTYGLPESEFLLVLEHLSAGMKHLRDNNLVHRDLKPGNIMKFISDDGRTIYKLTDFGAARELEENQPFASLYGTEEYLHPDMYERAVLRKSINRSFTANVDLWSIGVTLYHVATGNLPFRPFGGRKNRETMHQITTKKTSGVISGTQHTENGAIEWSRTLPPHCQLSAGLKAFVTPLLAGLLEENRDKTWSFDRFFQEVTIILRKRVVHIYYINRSLSAEIFLEPNEHIENFQEHICIQTQVSMENQILLFNNEHIENNRYSKINGGQYPQTDIQNPIFLYSKDNNDVQLPAQLDLPKFPNFPNNVSVENDASLAKASSSVGHECKRRIDAFTTMDVLMKKGVRQFIDTLTTTINLLLRKTQNLDQFISVLMELTKLVLSIKKQRDNGVNNYSTIKKSITELRQEFDRVYGLVQQLHTNFVTDDVLNEEWQNLMQGKRCPCKSRAGPKAKHLVDRIRDSWQHLLRDRATRTLTYNDEQFHALEKIKVDGNGRKLKSLLLDDVKPNVEQMAECLADWYKVAQTFYLKTQILAKDLMDCDKMSKNIYNDVQVTCQYMADLVGKDYIVSQKILPIRKMDIQSDIQVVLRESKDVRDILREQQNIICNLMELSSEDNDIKSPSLED